jgi:hypothetical protein
MAGIWIEISDGFHGYLAVPASGTGPGLVLLQEIFGVNRYIRDVADLYAEEGYVVLAPDLFWRLEPGVELEPGEADFPCAMALHERLDTDQTMRDVAAAIACLRARPECTGKAGDRARHHRTRGACLTVGCRRIVLSRRAPSAVASWGRRTTNSGGCTSGARRWSWGPLDELVPRVIDSAGARMARTSATKGVWQLAAPRKMNDSGY